tara:strand:+ start:50 stop:706 length:657 start_codon:yes stop_codon:yes gene_type:complete
MELSLLEVIKFRKKGLTNKQIADKFGVSTSTYENFVTKNKSKLPRPIKIKGSQENIKKWKRANPNLNFDKLTASQKSTIKKSGNIYIGTGINPAIGHRKIDVDINKIKRMREKEFTTEQIAKELGVSISVIEKRVKEEGMPTVSNKKISSERLKLLNDAAKKYGFKDFASVKGRDKKINITKDATRREEGIPEGKGRPGVKRTKAEREAIKKGHWANN